MGPRGCFDQSQEIVLELHFGEGGEDSKKFVGELFAAYVRYAESLGLRTEILDNSCHGHVIAKVLGNGAGKAFSREGGKHCVQRYPDNDRGGRRHTSVVSVAVLPLPPERTYKPLPDRELEITAQTGSQKAGGQKVNKTSSAIRAKHVPTGIAVFIQNERQQSQNKAEAIRILTAKVNELRNSATQRAYEEIRKTQVSDGGRGCKVRTYNFIDSRATDHRTGVKTSKIEAVMAGRFSLLK
jgi:peptide chain release factor 1